MRRLRRCGGGFWQRRSMEALQGEVEEESVLASSAVGEAMATMLRLQREKSEVQMKLCQFCRLADGPRCCRDRPPPLPNRLPLRGTSHASGPRAGGQPIIDSFRIERIRSRMWMLRALGPGCEKGYGYLWLMLNEMSATGP